MKNKINRFYESASVQRKEHLRSKLKKSLNFDLESLEVEYCYNVESSGLGEADTKKLIWMLGGGFYDFDIVKSHSIMDQISDGCIFFEIGPRLSFTTAFSTNAVSACRAAGLTNVTRVEKSCRYRMIPHKSSVTESLREDIVNSLHDRMTECEYSAPIESFQLAESSMSFTEIDILKNGGMEELLKANVAYGLALDDWDLEYYFKLFRDKVKRNPTDVELFDLAQSNSEHCRHWFFKGKMSIDGEKMTGDLFKMIMQTQESSNQNNVIKFSDNSSGIQGFVVSRFATEAPSMTEYRCSDQLLHIIYTAETHNFPTGVCPFPGAATGTGGRIRDVQAAGRGASPIAGIAGYSFGNLRIEGYNLPWENAEWIYPKNFARPREIIVEASNGASDYGNKFGEPVITGFSRSFGLLFENERVEWIKPIMFSGGIGSISDKLIQKSKPEPDMLVVKLGGPPYRIGVGGGSASSVHVQGDGNRTEKLDFGAVQRGDPEMEQKMNRVIRACVEMEEKNPILSIHDQGAGGNGNVLKELVEGAGAVISADSFHLADPTLSLKELWGAEYQESNAVLIAPHNKGLMEEICRRERCPVNFVGKVTGDNKIILEDFSKKSEKRPKMNNCVHPVDLDLDWVLGKMPQKEFPMKRKPRQLEELHLPENLSLIDALERVMRLPSVASKRFLTNKVDRSVTGLVAQQQCVGPLHTPLADVAVVALSYFGKSGGAVAVGEQPIKGLINAASGARMSVGEALTNLVFAPITDLKDVKCSGNWMWPAKLPGEGAELVTACKAMCDVMKELGIAVDGGKDSLSMAAKVGDAVVKSPGALVISAYAACPDITKVITPDLKAPEGKGVLLYVPFGGKCRNRLGGSALAQCYSQIGNSSPDMDSPKEFVEAFRCTQKLIADGLLSAGHDISDGGFLMTAMEMAFAGNCSLTLQFSDKNSSLDVWFAEELGIIVEVLEKDVNLVIEKYGCVGVNTERIGHSSSEYGPEAKLRILCEEREVLCDNISRLRDIWEETSFELEKLQSDVSCAISERNCMRNFTELPWTVSFSYSNSVGTVESLDRSGSPKVAVIREEGSNGDREMSAAFFRAGFRVLDVCMEDLLSKRIILESFRGLAFVGGFSYADVLGSAKGWASSVLFHDDLKREFEDFFERPDTFSLGVCNGCQLMAHLGWIGHTENQKGVQTVALEENNSGRFESRFSSVKIMQSPSIMLKDMEESVLGVWLSHAEGKFAFRDPTTMINLKNASLIPLRYVNELGNWTEVYPINPNGSFEGIAGVCSRDGRHLAVMPHPERCFLTWQWPYWPEDRLGEKRKDLNSPWMKMFQNAYSWCTE